MLALCYKVPKQREETIAGIVAMMAQTTPDKARDRIIIGGKQECVDKIERFIKAGVTHFIFMHNPPMTAEEDIQAFAEDIIPQFRSR
jgi:alkanesulfonate monooxygenase SsuD/methylene tetrahydromethanopterin reductase-like flavin-dependent oxidoreductase (luciferase family)